MRHLNWMLLVVGLVACSDDSSGTSSANNTANNTTNNTLDAGSDAQTASDISSGDQGVEDTALPDDGFPDANIDATSDVPDISLPDPNDIDDDLDGFTENQGDCDDLNADVSPGVVEICGNTIDDDCDGSVDDVPGVIQKLGPLPYLQASDSPWANETFTNFVVEDMEDQMLPDGVTASTFSWSSSFSLAVVDSVDGDDGDATNGVCNPCEAMWSTSSITFTFDQSVLGRLPTHVGVVVTDSGSPNVTVNLSATSACTDLGELSSTIIFGDGSIGGETAEDRFVGFESPTGISSITIGVGTTMEIDHLQFGW